MTLTPPSPLLLALSTSAALSATAHAGTPTRWDRVTGTDGGASDQVGLARTGDGVLHVAWQNANSSALQHTVIRRDGRLGATTPIQTGWAFVANPDLLRLPDDGLRMFFGGQRTTVTGDPNTEMNTATADASGAAWALQPFDAAGGSQGAAAAGAALAADATPFVSWGATSGVFVHRGISPADPNHDYQGALGGCCGYAPDLALDGATGQLTVAWYSNAAGREGVWAQGVDAASGAPMGAPALMPGSATGGKSSQMVSRTPIAGRPGRRGVYVAYPGGYPAQDRVLLWSVGASSSRTLVRDSDVAHDIAGVSGAPDGRLWVFWSEQSGGGQRIVATRSNRTATKFGAYVSVRVPRGTVDTFHLDGDAQPDRLDLLGAFAQVGGTASWHRQVLPGLTLRVKRLGRGRVRATVTDAGDPVAGATVRAAGASAETNRRGRATLRPGARRVRVTVRKASYTGAAVRLGRR
jgi:hypothetical protein